MNCYDFGNNLLIEQLRGERDRKEQELAQCTADYRATIKAERATGTSLGLVVSQLSQQNTILCGQNMQLVDQNTKLMSQSTKLVEQNTQMVGMLKESTTKLEEMQGKYLKLLTFFGHYVTVKDQEIDIDQTIDKIRKKLDLKEGEPVDLDLIFQALDKSNGQLSVLEKEIRRLNGIFEEVGKTIGIAKVTNEKEILEAVQRVVNFKNRTTTALKAVVGATAGIAGIALSFAAINNWGGWGSKIMTWSAPARDTLLKFFTLN